MAPPGNQADNRENKPAPKDCVESCGKVREAKPRRGKGVRKVGYGMSTPVQLNFSFEVVSSVPKSAKQETEACRIPEWDWVEASVWTKRMLAALVNGVKGGKWYSLIIDNGQMPFSLSVGFSP